MIEIGNMSFGYLQTRLFRELTVRLGHGGIYGLLGKNGAGKTTLLRLISGLLRADMGSCRVLGYESERKNPAMLQQIFFIPESFYLPTLTIAQFRSLHAPFYPLFSDSAFKQFLQEMELDERQPLDSLSYGLSKRFMLAFGLATNARILLLDEPTNGLDIPSKRVFRKLLAGVINEERLFLIATHQIKEMENILDHLIFIDRGRILLDSSLEEISRELSFRTVSNPEQMGEVLYKEEIPGGYSVLERNSSGSDSSMDLEFLFNAVMTSTVDFRSILHQQEEDNRG